MVSKQVPQVDIAKILAHKQAPYEITLTDKAAILYSLGIGFSRDPMNRDDFKFTYEFDSDFRPFPTNAVTIAQVSEASFRVPGLPDFNPMMLLHGEEDVYFHKPLAKGTTYVIQESIADIQDKGKGALLICKAELFEKDTKQLAAVCQASLFIRGLGGFGYKGTLKSQVPANMPKRPADFTGEEKTMPN